MNTRDETSFRQFVKLVKEDYWTHQADWTLPGFRAVAVHRFGVWVRSLRSRVLRAPLSVLQRMMFRYVRNHYSIELSRDCVLGRRVRLAHQGGMVIGALQIGDDCIIRQNVTVGAVSQATWRERPVLKSRVEVGSGAVLIGPIVIGDDVRIGPNAVVSTDVPAGAAVMAPLSRILPMRPPADLSKAPVNA